jgi:hypothetical protein
LKTRETILLLLFTATLHGLTRAQTIIVPIIAPIDSSTGVVTAHAAQGVIYARPTQSVVFHNYLLETFGPYPIVGSAVTAGLDQFTNSPPEWNQGMAGYGRRFGSDFGIGVVRTSTRYAMAGVLKEDTLYYRCQCNGIFGRAGHAIVSALTARRGADGHVVFSFPSLVAPYAGTMVGVYGWYPSRYNAKDAFRMGNYSLLVYMGGNLALEFSPRRSGALLSRFHLRNPHGAPDSETP